MPSLRLIVRINAIAMSLSFASVAAAQAPIWSTPWTATGAPVFAQGSLAAAVVDASGNIVVAAPSPSTLDYQVVDISPAGALNWSANIGDGLYGGFEDGTNVLRTGADGSVFFSFSNPYDGYLSKIDASGAIAWSRFLPSAWLAVPASGPLIAGGCEWGNFSPALISNIDRDTGAVNWQFSIRRNSTQCELADVLVDPVGNTYVSTRSESYNGAQYVLTAHLYKVDASGREVWEFVPPTTDMPALMGADASQVYVGYNNSLSAISAGNGSVGWSVPAGKGVVVGNPAEAVVFTSNGVSRLAAATGQPRWTNPVTGWSIALVNGALVVAGANSGSDTTRLDPASGGTVWSTTMPAPVGHSLSYLPVQAIDANTLLFPASYFYTTDAPVPVLQTLDFATGQPGADIPVPSVAQGFLASSVLGADGHIEGIYAGRATGTFEIRLRELNAANGALLWEAREPVANTCVPCYDESIGAASDANSAIALYTLNNQVYSPPGTYGGSWLFAFDKLTGVKRWGMNLTDLFQGETHAADPVMAGDGDALVGIGTSVMIDPFVPNPVRQGESTVYKFAAADGHQVWKRTVVDPSVHSSSTWVDPPLVVAVGADVVATGAFETQPATSSVVRLSGTDGSTQWASSVFAAPGINDLFAVEGGNLIAVTWAGWAMLDGATGSTLWSGTIAVDPYCIPNVVNSCVLGYAKALPGGDIVYGGFAAEKPWLRRLRGDGSGIVDSWHLEQTVPGVRSIANEMFEDAAGNLWVRLTRHYRDSFTAIQMLASFDPVSGQFTGQQMIGTYYGDAQTATSEVDLLGAPENQRLPVNTLSVDHPQPSVSGNALLDTTVLANGDLVATTSTSAAKAIAGKLLTFHFAAMYTGDAAVSGVTLLGNLPWQGGVSGIACTTSAASNCVVDTTSGNVHATFDIQPGGSVDISGQVRVLDNAASTQHVEEVVYGPIGLREPDTGNNLSRTDVEQVIFADGFEL